MITILAYNEYLQIKHLQIKELCIVLVLGGTRCLQSAKSQIAESGSSKCMASLYLFLASGLCYVTFIEKSVIFKRRH